MNKPAWSKTLETYGRAIHQYKDADGRNLYRFTCFGLETEYVIHREEELDFKPNPISWMLS